MSNISISIPQAQRQAAERLLDPKQYRFAIVRGVNRTMTSARAAMTKNIRKVYFIKAGEIKRRSPTIRANTKTLSAKISVSNEKINLLHFSPTRRRVGKGIGATARIRRGGREVIDKRSRYSKHKKGGFLLDGRGVFERKTRKRKPIERLDGPSVKDMFNNANVRGVVINQIRRNLSKNVQREVSFRLRKLSK